MRYLTLALRELHEHPIERATASAVIGVFGLKLAHIQPDDLIEGLMAFWGAGAGVFGLLTIAASAACRRDWAEPSA